MSGEGSSKKRKKLMKRNDLEITENDNLLEHSQGTFSTLTAEGNHKKKRKKFSME